MKKLIFLCFLWSGLIEAQTDILKGEDGDISYILNEYLKEAGLQDIVNSASSVRVIMSQGDIKAQDRSPVILVLIESDNVSSAEDLAHPEETSLLLTKDGIYEDGKAVTVLPARSSLEGYPAPDKQENLPLLTRDGKFESEQAFAEYPLPKRPLLSFSSIKNVKMIDCSSMPASGIEGGGFIPDDTFNETVYDEENAEYLLERDRLREYCQ